VINPVDKAGRLVQTVINADETVQHIETALGSFDRAVLDLNATIARLTEALVAFTETVDRVDATLERVGEIADQLGEIVDAAAPALALNEKVRTQVERVKTLRAERASRRKST
jgi:methyl-accepting chemotaxis protein